MNKTKFPKIYCYPSKNYEFDACYIPDYNMVLINISPCSFKNEYEFYGFSGLVRELSARVIHELTHWATDNMNGHGDKATLGNLFRTRNLLQTNLWTLKIHSILYDLQRKDSWKTYFDVEDESS